MAQTINLDRFLRSLEPVKTEAGLLSYDEAWYRWLGVRRKHDLSLRTSQPYMSVGASSSKLTKNPIETLWLSAAPAQSSGIGVDACSHRTDACTDDCIMNEGRLGMPYALLLKAAKTDFLYRDMRAAVSLIWHETTAALKAQSGELGERLNAAMDVRWELFAPVLFDLPVQFYDYSAWPFKVREKALPANYHVTWSAKETHTDKWIWDTVNTGRNVAVLLRVHRDAPMADTWQGLPLIDGDKHDYRPFDAPGSVVGLRAKDKAILDTSGFVREPDW
jgi:hypothetical protein